MVTLRRFRALAESYGADLQRWPQEVRREAEALLKVSSEARACLDETRKLDDAIEAARGREDARLRQLGDEDAALARLRSSVEARIAAPGKSRASHRHLGVMGRGGRWTLSLQFRWAGMATAGGVAIMAGLLIGSMLVPAPEPDGVLSTLLQPAPINMLAD